MLSLDRVRELVGEPNADERRLTELRDQSDRLARILIEMFQQKKKPS